MTWDVLILGDANPDLVLRGDVAPRFDQSEQLLEHADLVIGGSGAITACGLATLGVSVALAAEVGDDLFGRHTRTLLDEAGVDTSLIWVSDAPTGLSVVLSQGGERSTLTLVGAIDAAPPPWRAPEDVPDARHLHVASAYLQPRRATVLHELLPLARAAGLSVSLDTNRDPADAYAGLAELLPHVDVLLPNAAEAQRMAACLADTTPEVDLPRVQPHLSVEEAAQLLCALGPTVAVKDGARGAVLCERGVTGRPATVRYGGCPVECVDTTGAGDSFNAGFLAAWQPTHDAVHALRWGCVAGSANVQAVGGTAGQIDRVVLERRVLARRDRATSGDPSPLGASPYVRAQDTR